MRYLIIFSMILFWVLVSADIVFARDQEVRSSLLTCLPRLEGLVPEGSPQKADNVESLFSIINGGAEMYVRHGFSRGLFQTYKDRDNRFYNLEIIETKDADVARKIYRLKTGSRGRKIKIGEEAVLEEYYLMFWQGRFYLSVSGPDSGKKTRDVILGIAGAVSEKIATFHGRQER